MKILKKISALIAVMAILFTAGGMNMKAVAGDISYSVKDDGFNDILYTINGIQYKAYKEIDRRQYIEITMNKTDSLVLQADLEGDSTQPVTGIAITFNYKTSEVDSIKSDPEYDFDADVQLYDRVIDGENVKEAMSWASKIATGFDNGILYGLSVNNPEGRKEALNRLTTLTIKPSQAAIEAGSMELQIENQVDMSNIASKNSVANRKFRIKITFTDGPTTTQLQAPTLTLESDADNGGLKYTVVDTVNNDKASSYAIDLFSDADCNTKVGNPINVSKEAMNGNIPLGNGITAGNTYYAKVKAVGDGVAYSDSTLSTSAVSAAAANEPVAVKNISFTALTANGSSTETTSKLTFTFSDDIDGLTADKITLSGVNGVTKGNLTRESTGVYKLAINNVSVSGTLKATIASIDGYSITPNEKTVAIYYAAPITNVVWSSAAADGVANKTTSTKIDVVFNTPITNLTK